MALGPSAPSRWGPTWAEFLRSQEKAILATDFFTVTLLDSSSVYVLAIIEHASHRVRILGVTAHPDNRWVTQMARNLIMDIGEQADAVTFLIRDRDTKFTGAFDAVFATAGIRILRSPIQASTVARMPSWNGGSVLPPRATRPHPDLEPASPAQPAARDFETHYSQHPLHQRQRFGLCPELTRTLLAHYCPDL